MRDASLNIYGHHETKWFHVTVDDDIARTLKKYGSYSFDWPLVPIYILLQFHQATDGTTYAGLASAQREWVLLFRDLLHISVHGEAQFVNHVRRDLDSVKH